MRISRRTEGDPIRVNLVSLGCPKNLVDSEVMLGRLGGEGFVVTPGAEDADVIIINTCGFVDSAKEESINTILEACQVKRESATPKKVVVTGCLSQRYGSELRQEIPELDAVFGLGEHDGLGRMLRDLVDAQQGQTIYHVSDPTKACNAEVGRFRLTPRHFAYVRISEGCDNPCTFCAIPAIRGRFRSKPIPIIEEEAAELVANGARELVLISQDTTSYGVDLDNKFQLPYLLQRLAAIDGVRWIRLLYAYPAFLNDEMIETIAGVDKVVNYLDMPLQHISDKMLRKMGRRMDERRTRQLLERLRDKISGLYLRTTFLVGFPGESEQDFGTLRDFVRQFEFERLGVFTYSQEEGTPSATFADPVPPELAQERLEQIMLLQQQIAFRQNRARVGETTDIVVDANDDDVRARSFAEAPEIDPSILIAGARTEENSTSREVLRPGDMLPVKITGTRDYDLVAEPLPASGGRCHSAARPRTTSSVK